jgi:hypothetical protein
MEELIAFIIQFVIEFGIQLFGSIGFDWAAGSGKKKADEKTAEDGCGWMAIFAALGGVCGGLSLLIAPNLLLPTLPLRVANLAAAPLLAGGMSYLFARHVWAVGGYRPRHHFWRAFVFALAFGVARFAYAHR